MDKPVPVLSCLAVTKRYDTTTVLPPVDLVLGDGDVAVLRGPNGSGKSTLLKCVAGVEEVSDGQIAVLGRDADERDPAFRRAVAAVLDDVGFLPDLAAVEQLELLARLHGDEDASTTAEAVLSEVGLADYSLRLPRTLSSGQRHRLALATALVRPSRLVLLDEPEQRLDRDGIAWLCERVARLARGGAAVLIASHHAELLAVPGWRHIRLGETASAAGS